MLTFTFRHLAGIGPKKEREFWRSGIHSLQALAATVAPQYSIFDEAANHNLNLLLQSIEALDARNADFFALHLAREEHYRIALAFPEDTLFLDIETTGLSLFYDKITMVGWSLGGDYYFWLRGQSIDPLGMALSHAKVVVTFNGTLFDLRFLKKEFPHLNIPLAHVDLRFLGRRVGLSGGQKHIEESLAIRRASLIKTVEGEIAPVLWHRFIRGDIKSAELLVKYNYADIFGMQNILSYCVDELMNKNGVPAAIRPSANFRTLDIRPPKSRTKITLAPKIAQRATVAHAIDILTLIPQGALAELRVVGIDLTGSEERPSGWCYLKGSVAETKRIGSTEELINLTVSCNPTIVSIDSPLTLPLGRKSVLDDDPGRQMYGITRECERILRKRGVAVYPSLIRSMQSLTERGIKLAQALRKRGIPVIESFPGAAQDIMGIPRKRASMDLLKLGLVDFGISGPFVDMEVSHDELDAITSAIVGIFFWSGHFEALGNLEEEYLIIPDLSDVSKSSWKTHVVGLSGPIAAGKTTSAEILSRDGFHPARYSHLLADLLTARGLLVSRKNLQDLGASIHQEPGQRWLSKLIVEALPLGVSSFVIDGLRWPEDHSFMVEQFGPFFSHFHIAAPPRLRLNRYVANGGSEAEFLIANSHSVEQSSDQLRFLAHSVIHNDSSPHELETNLTFALASRQ